jgi:hypothetical protein
MLKSILRTIARRRWNKAAAAYEAYSGWSSNRGPWNATIACALLRKADRAGAAYARLI